MSNRLQGLVRARRPVRPGLRLAGLGVAGLVVVSLGLTVPAQASVPGHVTAPASIGPGVDQPTTAQPATRAVHAALRCAVPAHQVGFKEHRAVIAVAVGMAESYCRPRAKGKNGATGGCPNGSVDRGLWQINSCYHPEVSKHCAFTPECNARAAKRISDRGTDWSPWSAYNSGTYRTYLTDAKRAVRRTWSATPTATGVSP